MIEAIRNDVQALATEKGRLVGSQGHAAAVGYLLGRIVEAGLEPYGDSFELGYEMHGMRFANLIGKISGTKSTLSPVLLAAHYDTCGPYPGADDNAAAVAVMLSIAEPLRALKLDRDVVFAFFDAEEPPYYLTPTMGSVYFYHDQRRGPVHCAVVMDLVGHDLPLPGFEDLLFITGMESDAGLADVLVGCEAPGIRILPTLNRYIGDMSDHHVFRANRSPYLFLSCGRWEHYHQMTDTPEKLNYEKIFAVARFLLEILPHLCHTPLPGPFEGYDSTEQELHYFRKHAGAFLESLGIRLQTREDIDRVAELMLGRFGL